MATILQNLSEYDIDNMPSNEVLSSQSYAIAVADWNSNITFALLEGAVNTLIKHGVKEENIQVVHVPGTFELSFAASKLMESDKYAAIITLGCVIQGDTPHFTFVCEGVTQGITQLNINKNACPVIFGVLTTNTLEQAEERAGGVHGNKGVEAAVTAIKMANIIW